ncbi:hypothetical protein KUTeg_006748 [Tegillarca granosa]|uniref:Uncharacterized protein n=1 Tax=Tegillarca granosa TaxID=220873 RepID=A0ABQ9FB83_TEGGR|nr:hypothetical protein KUTeg_006748 [Tegillarca granosa]
MESKYDRVAYPENVYLHSDGEMDDFGTGVYPVQRRPYRDDNTFKVACIKVKRRFRFFAVVAILILVLVIIAIAVIATATVSNHINNQNNQKVAEDTIDLPYSNTNDKKYAYSTSIMSSQPEAYTKCTDSKGPPVGKECQLDAQEFGNECTFIHHHGFDQGRPCVLLVLRLPADTKPIPFSNTSSVYQTLGQHWSPDHIGVTCDGADAESKEHLRHKIDYHDSGNRSEDLADVLPPKGFPVAFFARKERLEQYQPPANVRYDKQYT